MSTLLDIVTSIFTLCLFTTLLILILIPLLNIGYCLGHCWHRGEFNKVYRTRHCKTEMGTYPVEGKVCCNCGWYKEDGSIWVSFRPPAEWYSNPKNWYKKRG